MKKVVMTQLLQLLDALNEVHRLICSSIKDGLVSDAIVFLGDGQKAATVIRSTIDKLEGEGTIPATLLEEYGQFLHSIHEQLLAGELFEPSDLNYRLNKCRIRIYDSMNADIQVKKEVVFLPYKASMWDSLESVWRAAIADPGYEVYVIPIPYYDKNSDGSLRECHYEGTEFPADVPIVHYDHYSLEVNHPDMIFIHNPYDDANYITTVHPYFYSKNLKQFTDKLVYIPYFVLDELEPSDPSAVEKMLHFAQVSAVINADVVIVQSEKMRLCYIEALIQIAGEKTRKYWEKIILGLGSPKYDKVADTVVGDEDIPDEWKKIITKTDGRRKKVMLYNTTVSGILQNTELAVEKMEDVLKVFQSRKDEIALLWRPHPLLEATISSMRPEILEKYQKLIETFRISGWGIYDDTADLNRAIAMADAYYGDYSSVVQLCKKAGIPIMLQNMNIFSA
jgi:hypothetical protein